jgi:hypothetical protein
MIDYVYAVVCPKKHVRATWWLKFVQAILLAFHISADFCKSSGFAPGVKWITPVFCLPYHSCWSVVFVQEKHQFISSRFCFFFRRWYGIIHYDPWYEMFFLNTRHESTSSKVRPWQPAIRGRVQNHLIRPTVLWFAVPALSGFVGSGVGRCDQEIPWGDLVFSGMWNRYEQIGMVKQESGFDATSSELCVCGC